MKEEGLFFVVGSEKELESREMHLFPQLLV
jgi:hypothetical protein